MTTAAELIALALLDAGIIGQGQTASAEDTTNARLRLNMMISQWSRKRWLVYRLATYSVTATGATYYTLGSGGNIDAPRTDRLESAFVRLVNPPAPNQVDYPLELLQSREDYNRIALKQLVSFPAYVFYEPSYPLGKVYPWPVPTSGLYEIFVTTKLVLDQITSLATAINLPDEYVPALHYNLVVRLRSAYQRPIDPVANTMAKEALNVLRGSNAQVPRLILPPALRRGGSGYNVWSDQGT